ncbi:ubiquitin-conjugating enzyme E2 D [Alternaria panax]|uniref:Ubiquitin-conjugating enzyme E2 2 n=1 Tax=Alternaria panax TaxID=48097 RepID=A0AAD4IKK2_9PLEO|nr:ubiquitin-conjugating enzyme E2 D [Alternaria panax]
MSSFPQSDLARTKKRLRQELQNISNDPIEGLSAAPVDLLNPLSWQATIKGPPATPYESGTFHLTMEFPEGYPRTPPSVRFITKVYHPNIDSENGWICLNILGVDWSPVLTVSTVLLSIRAFLDSPDTDDPACPGIANEYVYRRDVFDETARNWTEEFAKRERVVENATERSATSQAVVEDTTEEWELI